MHIIGCMDIMSFFDIMALALSENDEAAAARVKVVTRILTVFFMGIPLSVFLRLELIARLLAGVCALGPLQTGIKM